MAFNGPERAEQSLRTDLLHPDMIDALAHVLRYGPFTSVEVRRDAGPRDLLEGNGSCISHRDSTSASSYLHRNDPDWAVVFDTDCPGDAQRGRIILEALER